MHSTNDHCSVTDSFRLWNIDPSKKGLSTASHVKSRDCSFNANRFRLNLVKYVPPHLGVSILSYFHISIDFPEFKNNVSGFITLKGFGIHRHEFIL